MLDQLHLTQLALSTIFLMISKMLLRKLREGADY